MGALTVAAMTPRMAPVIATTLVWIDRDEAFIVRWADRATIDRVRSDVPPAHRSTGHVRHDPAVRHGGGGMETNQLERVIEQRLRAFVRDVAERVPPDDDVHVVGPGDVRERLERRLRREDRRLHRARLVRTAPSDRLTERELVAHVRELAGDPPPRRMPRA